MEIKKGSYIKNNLGKIGLIFSVDENSIVVKYLLSGANKNIGATFKHISNEELVKSLNNKELELIDEAKL